jgi:AcrR family transcriptional regulator
MTMARDRGDFQRARRPEQKRQRETAILEAARELALREGIRNISLADIAGEIGMHKTALLRYFETREQIYLRLGDEAWQDWADTLGPQLTALPAGDIRGIGEAFGRTLNDRPFLCDVFIHSPLNLERNVSVESLLNFKLSAYTAVRTLANAVRVVLPDLSDEDSLDLVGAVTAIAAALWQVVHPAPEVTQIYVENPTLALNYHDFVATIARFVETLALGMHARYNR